MKLFSKISEGYLVVKNSLGTASKLLGAITAVINNESIEMIPINWNEIPWLLNIFKNSIYFFCIILLLTLIYNFFKNSVDIKSDSYKIKVEYNDLFDMKECKKVIAFDECFTLDVGEQKPEIKPSSICGQYLKKYPLKCEELKELINNAKLEKENRSSQYKDKDRYTSGKLVPRNDFLLMPFAKLDNEGIGHLTREEFLDCLNVLWKEIDKYYAQNDVCIPILGSGITRFEDKTLNKQELLDLIITSYKISPYKIKSPNTLHIVCKKSEDFSLNKIGETI